MHKASNFPVDKTLVVLTSHPGLHIGMAVA